ncbi:DUF309 domain-containing protein [Myxococcota bacterium]|nr:DUF309 domain-containing protein [Myxococcota bacterium]
MSSLFEEIRISHSSVKRDELLDRAVADWARGDFYEAHEVLEEVAEAVEDDDGDHEIALALVHVAACLHKLVDDVGKAAVPAKLERALDTLRAADPAWLGLALGRFTQDLEALATSLRTDGVARAFTAAALPKLGR